jgi:hypothetical protein
MNIFRPPIFFHRKMLFLNIGPIFEEQIFLKNVHSYSYIDPIYNFFHKTFFSHF